MRDRTTIGQVLGLLLMLAFLIGFATHSPPATPTPGTDADCESLVTPDRIGHEEFERYGIAEKLQAYEDSLSELVSHLTKFQSAGNCNGVDKAVQESFEEAVKEFKDSMALFPDEHSVLANEIEGFRKRLAADLPKTNDGQHSALKAFRPICGLLACACLP